MFLFKLSPDVFVNGSAQVSEAGYIDPRLRLQLISGSPPHSRDLARFVNDKEGYDFQKKQSEHRLKQPLPGFRLRKTTLRLLLLRCQSFP